MKPSAEGSKEPKPPPSERARIALLRMARGGLRAITVPFRLWSKGEEETLHVVPYRGYGGGRVAIVRGRLMESASDPSPDEGRLSKLWRRLSSPPVATSLVTGTLGTRTVEVQTEEDGLFTLRFEGLDLDASGQWEEAELAAWPTEKEGDREARVEATAPVLVPDREAAFGVISDVDDTVVYTGVANKLAMMWRLFATEAEARMPFEGVGPLYRALHRGTGESADNPIFYVSRGPWGIYPVLDEFFHQHEIPVGPVLLLRDWGINLTHPWPLRAEDHKRELIDEVLETYPDLPFLLVGDSGQHDPEIYAAATERWKDRILCSYIRDVSADDERSNKIEELARRCARLGSEMVLVEDSGALANHAAKRGFIRDEDARGLGSENGSAKR